MKIRNGFVSNSSSSSFCIYGAMIPLSGFPEEAQIELERRGELKDTFLNFYKPDGCDYFVGSNWCCIGGEETGNQFKKKVEVELNRILGHDVECSTIDKTYYC